MAERFVRTEAGRREVHEHAKPLSRAARNLLVIIDASKTADEWLALVHGCTAGDVQQLLGAGLIAAAASPGTPGAAAARPQRTLDQALEAQSYSALYELLTQQARPRLGLVKGYRMVLEVEKCNGPAEIRALTARFVEMVREVQGVAEARALRRQLGADD